MADLTAKQQAFVDEYLVDFNGTQAAIRAGYSADAASEIAYENLRKPQIAAAVAAKLGQRAVDAEDRAARAAKRLEEIALMDLGETAIRAVPPPLLSVVRNATVDLLKLDGKFVEKHENKNTVVVNITTDDAGLL